MYAIVSAPSCTSRWGEYRVSPRDLLSHPMRLREIPHRPHQGDWNYQGAGGQAEGGTLPENDLPSMDGTRHFVRGFWGSWRLSESMTVCWWILVDFVVAIACTIVDSTARGSVGGRKRKRARPWRLSVVFGSHPEDGRLFICAHHQPSCLLEPEVV